MIFLLALLLALAKVGNAMDITGYKQSNGYKIVQSNYIPSATLKIGLVVEYIGDLKIDNQVICSHSSDDENLKSYAYLVFDSNDFKDNDQVPTSTMCVSDCIFFVENNVQPFVALDPTSSEGSSINILIQYMPQTEYNVPVLVYEGIASSKGVYNDCVDWSGDDSVICAAHFLVNLEPTENVGQIVLFGVFGTFKSTTKVVMENERLPGRAFGGISLVEGGVFYSNRAPMSSLYPGSAIILSYASIFSERRCNYVVQPQILQSVLKPELIKRITYKTSEVIHLDDGVYQFLNIDIFEVDEGIYDVMTIDFTGEFKKVEEFSVPISSSIVLLALDEGSFVWEHIIPFKCRLLDSVNTLESDINESFLIIAIEILQDDPVTVSGKEYTVFNGSSMILVFSSAGDIVDVRFFDKTDDSIAKVEYVQRSTFSDLLIVGTSSGNRISVGSQVFSHQNGESGLFVLHDRIVDGKFITGETDASMLGGNVNSVIATGFYEDLYLLTNQEIVSWSIPSTDGSSITVEKTSTNPLLLILSNLLPLDRKFAPLLHSPFLITPILGGRRVSVIEDQIPAGCTLRANYGHYGLLPGVPTIGDDEFVYMDEGETRIPHLTFRCFYDDNKEKSLTTGFLFRIYGKQKTVIYDKKNIIGGLHVSNFRCKNEGEVIKYGIDGEELNLSSPVMPDDFEFDFYYQSKLSFVCVTMGLLSSARPMLSAPQCSVPDFSIEIESEVDVYFLPYCSFPYTAVVFCTTDGSTPTLTNSEKFDVEAPGILLSRTEAEKYDCICAAEGWFASAESAKPTMPPAGQVGFILTPATLNYGMTVAEDIQSITVPVQRFGIVNEVVTVNIQIECTQVPGCAILKTSSLTWEANSDEEKNVEVEIISDDLYHQHSNMIIHLYESFPSGHIITKASKFYVNIIDLSFQCGEVYFNTTSERSFYEGGIEMTNMFFLHRKYYYDTDVKIDIEISSSVNGLLPTSFSPHTAKIPHGNDMTAIYIPSIDDDFGHKDATITLKILDVSCATVDHTPWILTYVDNDEFIKGNVSFVADDFPSEVIEGSIVEIPILKSGVSGNIAEFTIRVSISEEVYEDEHFIIGVNDPDGIVHLNVTIPRDDVFHPKSQSIKARFEILPTSLINVKTVVPEYVMVDFIDTDGAPPNTLKVLGSDNVWLENIEFPYLLGTVVCEDYDVKYGDQLTISLLDHRTSPSIANVTIDSIDNGQSNLWLNGFETDLLSVQHKLWVYLKCEDEAGLFKKSNADFSLRESPKLYFSSNDIVIDSQLPVDEIAFTFSTEVFLEDEIPLFVTMVENDFFVIEKVSTDVLKDEYSVVIKSALVSIGSSKTSLEFHATNALHKTTQAFVEITIDDNVKPVVEITHCDSHPFPQSTTQISFQVTDNQHLWDCAKNADYCDVVCVTDDDVHHDCSQMEFTIENILGGTHNITIIATDKSGNVGTGACSYSRYVGEASFIVERFEKSALEGKDFTTFVEIKNVLDFKSNVQVAMVDVRRNVHYSENPFSMYMDGVYEFKFALPDDDIYDPHSANPELTFNINSAHNLVFDRNIQVKIPWFDNDDTPPEDVSFTPSDLYINDFTSEVCLGIAICSDQDNVLVDEILNIVALPSLDDHLTTRLEEVAGQNGSQSNVCVTGVELEKIRSTERWNQTLTFKCEDEEKKSYEETFSVMMRDNPTLELPSQIVRLNESWPIGQEIPNLRLNLEVNHIDESPVTFEIDSSLITLGEVTLNGLVSSVPVFLNEKVDHYKKELIEITVTSTNSKGLKATGIVTFEVIDDIAPEIKFVAVPERLSDKNSELIDFSVWDNGNLLLQTENKFSSFCQFDDGAIFDCVSPFQIIMITGGDHKFSVRSTDLSGNTVENSYSWTRIDVAIDILYKRSLPDTAKKFDHVEDRLDVNEFGDSDNKLSEYIDSDIWNHRSEMIGFKLTEAAWTNEVVRVKCSVVDDGALLSDYNGLKVTSDGTWITVRGTADKINDAPQDFEISCSFSATIAGHYGNHPDVAFLGRTQNVVWPRFSDVLIHSDDERISSIVDGAFGLTSSGSENMTLLASAETAGNIFDENTEIEISGLSVEILHQNSTSITFTAPSFDEVCTNERPCDGTDAYRALVIKNFGSNDLNDNFAGVTVCPNKCIEDHSGLGIFFTTKCIGFENGPRCQEREFSRNCGVGSGLTCKPCPSSSICPGGDRMWALPGFWQPTEVTYPIACSPPDGRCGGWDKESGEPTCGDNFTGPECQSCVTGYYPGFNGLECLECPSDTYKKIMLPVLIMFGVAVVVFILMFGVVWYATRKNGGSLAGGAVRTFQFVIWTIMTIQTVVQVGKQAEAQLPGYLMNIYTVLNIFQLEVSFVHANCLGDDPLWMDKVQMMSFLAIFGVALFVGILLHYLRRDTTGIIIGKPNNDVKPPGKFLRNLNSPNIIKSLTATEKLLMLLLGISYPIACNVSLRSVDCYKITGSGWVLRSNPVIECLSSEGATANYLGISCLVFVVILFPISTWIRLNYLKKKILIEVKENLKQFATPRSTPKSNRTPEPKANIHSKQNIERVFNKIITKRDVYGTQGDAGSMWDYFMKGEFQPSMYSFRHLNMICLLWLSVVMHFGIKIWYTTALSIIGIVYCMWRYGRVQPYVKDHSWKHSVKFGILIVTLFAVVVNFIVYLSEVENVSSLETVGSYMSAGMLFLSICLLLLLVYSFVKLLFSGAEKEKKESLSNRLSAKSIRRSSGKSVANPMLSGNWNQRKRNTVHDDSRSDEKMIELPHIFNNELMARHRANMIGKSQAGRNAKRDMILKTQSPNTLKRKTLQRQFKEKANRFRSPANRRLPMQIIDNEFDQPNAQPSQTTTRTPAAPPTLRRSKSFEESPSPQMGPSQNRNTPRQRTLEQKQRKRFQLGPTQQHLQQKPYKSHFSPYSRTERKRIDDTVRHHRLIANNGIEKRRVAEGVNSSMHAYSARDAKSGKFKFIVSDFQDS